MKSPLGFGVAMLATASFVVAGGEGDKKKGDDKKGGPKKEASTPLQDGWSGGPGKGLTYSSEMFSLKLKNRGQIRFNYNDYKGTLNGAGLGVARSDAVGFDIKRARTSLSGHIWNKDITYKLQTDWTNGTSIKDLWIDYRFHNTEKYDIGVRVGQQKIAFGNEWRTSSENLEFVDRSVTTRTFSAVRSRGATLHGDMSMGDDGGNLGWSISAFNNEIAKAARNSGEDGDTRSPGALAGADYNDDTDDRWNWHGELHWSSKAKAGLGSAQGDLAHDGQSAFGAGLGYYFGNGRRAPAGSPSPLPAGTPAIEVETDSGNIWGSWYSGNGIAVNGEYFVRAENGVGANAALAPGGTGAADSNGFQVSATWVAAPNEGQSQWGAGLRYSEVFMEDTQNMLTGGVLRGVGGGVVTEIEAVVNMFYHEHKMKTQFGITWQNIDPVAPAVGGVNSIDNYLIAIQTQFVF